MHHTILHLSCISGVGSQSILRIYNALGPHQISRIYRMSVADIQACGVSQRVAQRVYDGLTDISIRDRELRAVDRVGARYVTIADEAYLHYLWNISTPPPVLYYYGASLNICEPSVAYVGSRKADAYARRVIDHMMPDIVAHNYTVVSGGAYGADTFAHQAALRHGGVTAAVLGSGLGYPYPHGNRRLFRHICQSGGVVMSPFAVDTKAHAHNFPIRNRVIAGLSTGVVVVQAARQSGAHITASYALDAGRDVGAVPGHIDDPLSDGVHELIRNGASMITSGADVIHMCGGDYQHARPASQVAHEEDPIVALCRTPQQFDALLAHTGMEFMHLQTRLMELQLAGKITQDMSGCWLAC